jgi:hypothetical protein
MYSLEFDATGPSFGIRPSPFFDQEYTKLKNDIKIRKCGGDINVISNLVVQSSSAVSYMLPVVKTSISCCAWANKGAPELSQQISELQIPGTRLAFKTRFTL